MRLFDFKCVVCGHELKDMPIPKKPYKHCRKPMRRKYAPTKSIFKGDGWTDARKEDR